jgi:hypothetical protein
MSVQVVLHVPAVSMLAKFVFSEQPFYGDAFFCAPRRALCIVDISSAPCRGAAAGCVAYASVHDHQNW